MKPKPIRHSVALSPELAAALREAVAAGDYANTGEAIRDAIRHWRERREHLNTAQQIRTRGKEIILK